MRGIHVLLVFLMLGFPSVLFAQGDINLEKDDCFSPCVEFDGMNDTVFLPKWEPHLSVSTGFLGNSYGNSRLFTSVAPSMIYRPNDKCTVSGGFRITSDMGVGAMCKTGGRSLVPYKDNGSTGLVSGYVEAQYNVSDNIWIAGSIYHIGGSYAPFFDYYNGGAFNVSATALSASAAFRFNEDRLLQVSFTYIRDHAGTMPFVLHDAWMRGGSCGPWSMYANHYQPMMPCSPMFFGGWCY